MSPPTDSLDFGLNFLDGRGLLGLRGRPQLDPIALERLELEIPNLRFPFDISGGAARFQTRRCRLREALLTCDQERLGRWLRARRLGGYGITDLAVRVGDGRIGLGFTARVGDAAVDATARAWVEPAGGQTVRVVVGDVRLYGFLPVPAPLWGLALLAGALATNGAQAPNGEGPWLRGLCELTLNPLEIALWQALPRSGWRLPAYRGAQVRAVRVGAGRVEIEYGDGAPAAAPLGAEAGRALCPAGEEALASNRIDDALAAFRAARAAEDDQHLTGRLLSILVASPARWDEAATLATEELERRGGAAAQLALATIEAERGQAEHAAGRYLDLAAQAVRDSDFDDQLAALQRAGALLLRCDPARATPLFEQILALSPPRGDGDQLAGGAREGVLARAAEQLAARYGAERRFEELARLERRRIALAADPAGQARAHIRLAAVRLDGLGDPARAQDELERAIQIDPTNPDAFRLSARVLTALGDRPRALAALDRLIALEPNPQRVAAAQVETARLLAEAGDPEGALARLRAALAVDGGSTEALTEEARLHARAGRAAEAESSYERALTSLAPGVERDPARAELLWQWAQIALGRGDRAAAARLLGRAADLSDDRRVLAAVAELAEADGRPEEAERALDRLAALGDRRAALQRARALLTLGRPAEARALAEAAERESSDATAIAIVAEASQAVGDSAAYRAALERLLAVDARPEVHAQLGLLAAQAGDLDAADHHLAAAGDLREALVARCEVLQRKGDDATLSEALEHLADQLGDDPSACSRTLVRLAQARHRLEQLERALEAYRGAVALDGENIDARVGMGDVAWQLRRWDDARQAWEPLHDRGLAVAPARAPRGAPVAAEPRAQMALRLGVVAERQGDVPAARAFYRAALERGATGGEAVRAHEALVALHEGRGESEEAVRVMLDAAADPRTGESDSARAGRLVAAAGVVRRRAGQGEEALAIYERALALDPLHLGALDALESIATASGDAERLAVVLGRKVAATRARPADQKAILARLATLQAERLGRPDAAREAHLRALEIDPRYRPSLLWLSQAARVAGDREQELSLLERLARLPPDPIELEVDVETRARLADLLAEAGRSSEAEREALRALELAPRHPRALEILDDLYTRAGRLADLEPVLSRRAEAEVGFERSIGTAFRRAALLEQLGRRKEAVAAYEQMVRTRPASSAAWERLAALHRDAGAWSELLSVLGRIAERRAADGEAGEASAIFVEMAHLGYDRMGDAARSAKLLERALELEPRSTLAVDGLLMLARAAGDVVSEEELLARRMALEDDPARRDALVVERARLRRERLDSDGALQLLADIPMERASDEALRLRCEIAEARAAWSEAALVLEQLAARARAAGDADAERQALRRQARIAWEELHHGRAAEPLYRRALELDPDDVAAATALAEVERGRGDRAGQLQALERLLRSLRRRFVGPQREADVCVEIAHLLRAGGDSAGAAARLREALEGEPSRADAQVLLGEILLEQGDARGAIDALQRAVGVEPDRATWALLGIAYQQQGEREKAAAALEQAGDAVDPAQRAEALERAGRQEEALAAWRAIGGEAGSGNAARILFERAKAAGQPAEAASWARQALAEGPCDPEALAIAASELDADALWVLAERTASRLVVRQAAEVWLVAARLLPPPTARAALLRSTQASPRADSLAALARLEGGEAGAAYARAALALDPSSSDAALALAELSRSPDVVTALRAAHGRAQGPARPALSVAIGRALRDQARDPAGARAALRRALDEGAEGAVAATAHRTLAELESAEGDPAAAERHLRALHAAGMANADELRRLAELLGERGDHTGAVEILREAGGPVGALARALEAAGRNDELVDLLDRSAEGAPPEEARAWLRHAGVVAEERLRDARRAAVLLERALRLVPGDADLLVRLGRLYAGPLADGDRAAACFARAHAADRTRTDVLVHLADFHFDRGELDPAEDYYRSAADHGLSDPAGRGHLLLRLAEIAQRKERDAVEEGHLRAATEVGVPAVAAKAWRALASLYHRQGDGGRRASAMLAWAEHEPERRGELLREVRALVDPSAAAGLDDQILRLDPADDAARHRVLNRLRGSSDEPALARRLAEEAGRAPPAAREALLVELAQVRERLAEHDAAFEAWAATVGAAPKVDYARRLVWAASRASRGAEAAAVIEESWPSPTGEAAALIAEALLGPGGDRERALPWIERAKEAGTTAPGSATLRAIWRSSARWSDLVADLDAEAARRSGAARVALELEAARVLEDDARDLGGAAARYARLFHRDSTQREVGARARGLYLAAGNEARALAVLEEEIAAAPPTEVATLRVQRAELLAHTGPAGLREAEGDLLAALAAEPRSGIAHAALGELRLRLGHLDAALPHLIAAADAPDVDPQRAAGSALAAAQHLAARGAHADAERLYRAAARLDPVDERAVLGLISLASARGDHAQVVELQGRALSLASDPRTRARLWLDRARVFREQLGRDGDSYRCLKEAVANDPELIPAVALLRHDAEQRGDWALAAELLPREIVAAQDDGTRGRLHAELGRLLEERSLDPEAALRNFEEACALGAQVWPDLARLYQAARRPREAAQALVQHASQIDGAPRDEALLRAAELYRRAGSASEAEALLGVLTGRGGAVAREAQSALLRLADDRGDAASLRQALEEQLAVEPEGEQRLELTRRLLAVAARQGDDDAVERCAAALLDSAPADTMAFVERKRLLAARGDDAALADLLRARAIHCGDSDEAAERLFEAGRLSERLDVPLRAAADYQAALDADPEHHGALDALADLAYRQRDVTRARKLYALLQGRPSTISADELWKRRGELAEAEADFEEARRCYQQAVTENSSLLGVHEALARLAVRRDDPTATFTHLRAILELIPLDDVDRITDLRQRLGDLGARIGAPTTARNYYELVIAQNPERTSALKPLAELYAQSGEWASCAEVLGRLSYLAETAIERADLTFRQAEIYRLYLGQNERANAGYLKAADLAPTHLPTLRRLTGYYLAEGDLASLREVVAEVENQGAGLGDAAVDAGLGLALLGDEQRAVRYLGVAAPAEIAATLARVYAPHPAALDPALRAAAKGLQRRSGEGGTLLRALEQRLTRDPADHGARMALARNADLAGDAARARPHYGVLAWIDPDGGAARRLGELGPPAAILGRDPRHPAAAGPLRDVLALLGPLVLGLVPPRSGVQSDPAWGEALAPLAAAMGWPSIAVASIDGSLLAPPAVAEPTQPPRLLLRRDLLDDPPAVAFAAARALHLLRAGVALIESRPDEDLVALLAAAGAVFDPAVRPSSPFARAWLAELRAIPLRPESLPPALLPSMRAALVAAARPGVSAEAAGFASAERLTANRLAYLGTADLAAALRALFPFDGAPTPEARSAALAHDPAIADLVAFATLLDGPPAAGTPEATSG